MKIILTSIIALILTPMAWGQRVIVPPKFEEIQEFRYAARFLNQYASLLDITQTEEIQNKLRRTKEDGFQYITGNDNIMGELTGTEDFSIAFDKGIYTAHWSVNGTRKVSCSFPANIMILTFLNKIELENLILKKIKDRLSEMEEIKLPQKDISELTPVAYSDFYIDDKGFYITPRLKHQIIYEQDKNVSNKCNMLSDTTHYRLESLGNMMLSGYSNYPCPINIKVNQYGYQFQTLSVPLSSLYNIFTNEGSVPYWGIKTFDGNKVQGLWVWVNPYGGFAHVLSVDTSINAIADGSPMTARLNCYLRLDNLKSMFEEYPEL